MSTIRKDNEADQISYNGWVADNIRLIKEGKLITFDVTPPIAVGDVVTGKIDTTKSILEYLKRLHKFTSLFDSADKLNSNYVDSRTPEQREADSKIKAETTTTNVNDEVYMYDTKEAKDLADEFQEYLDGLAHAPDEEIMQKWNDSQFANQESEYQKRIAETFDSVRDMMLKKNEEYGDSVFQSIELFGHSIDAKTACLARISDKFKRLETLGLSEASVDTLDDLVGYLIALKLIIEDEQDFELDQEV